jgi:hypothetical protein
MERFAKFPAGRVGIAVVLLALAGLIIGMLLRIVDLSAAFFIELMVIAVVLLGLLLFDAIISLWEAQLTTPREETLARPPDSRKALPRRFQLKRVAEGNGETAPDKESPLETALRRWLPPSAFAIGLVLAHFAWH